MVWHRSSLLHNHESTRGPSSFSFSWVCVRCQMYQENPASNSLVAATEMWICIFHCKLFHYHHYILNMYLFLEKKYNFYSTHGFVFSGVSHHILCYYVHFHVYPPLYTCTHFIIYYGFFSMFSYCHVLFMYVFFFFYLSIYLFLTCTCTFSSQNTCTHTYTY